ncbi:epimerase [Marinobacterium aestuarii]|uniref:Epimerase n=1 Tax=Marinobacterium aestuarii TaxID=1821621 RepID=A0A1A9EXZ1_9GAMM|nr:GDP-mannose 4,6-dehydratase [Marinobacterium aestuarii]ANG62491.1 epimerase [Marinobacterium aestuarii]
MASQGSVLITGGAGFIGSELSHLLSKCAERVIIVDSLINGKRENIQKLLTDRVTFYSYDICDLDKMIPLLKEVDVVFHLACLGVRHSIHSPLKNHDVNATATLNLLKASREAGVGRFVYVSSSEVYGTAQWVPMTENHPTLPMTVYGGSKLAGESYTRAFFRTYEYPTVVVRPFNSFGPRSHHEGDSGEVIPKFLLRAMTGHPLIIHGDGSQTRDFTYVSDTARGILCAGFSEKAVGQTINLGQGEEITINELARLVNELVKGRTVDVVHEAPRPGDVLRLYADTNQARELLDFRPKVSLKEGLGRLKAWYEGGGKSPETLLKDEVTRNWNI